MRLWTRAAVPCTAALGAVLLCAAAASGIDQMVNVKIVGPGQVTVSSLAGGEGPLLRHLVLRGLAKGSLPGGFPFDEPREEKYEEKYEETLRQPPAIT
jgi:hypothetical protein